MNNIIIEKKHITEYIQDTLSDSRIAPVIVNNAKYHHNTSYSEAPNICRYGILSLVEQSNQGLKNYTSKFLEIMDDTESHVNGKDSISLSVVGLQDLYVNEDEYNPFAPSVVDFLITSDIRATRSTHHYGNEFLVRGSIETDKIKSVDIRILQLAEILKKNEDSKIYSIEELIAKYNKLRDIALAIKEGRLDIPLREMSSEDNYNLDIDKIGAAPKLILK